VKEVLCFYRVGWLGGRDLEVSEESGRIGEEVQNPFISFT